MKQEPVAWIPKDMELAKPKDLTNCIPLYTEPQYTELSDEEIVRISETCDLNHVLGLIDFARAILKKASEK